MKAKRNRSSLIVVLVLVMAFALTGCSSATVEETKVSETTVEPKEEVTEVEVAEVEPEVAEPTPEPTAEPTPEPTPEAIVYEGIDMQSSSPVAEWTMTFLGVIEEPKFIIANDETNKKVILEEGDEAIVEEGDRVIFYNPNEINVNSVYGGDIGRIIVESSININEYCEQLIFMEGTFTKKSTLRATTPTADGEKVVSCVLIPE